MARAGGSAGSGGSADAALADPTVDTPTPFDLLLSCPAGLTRSQIWKSRCASTPFLFNGLKFRYGGFHIIKSDEASIMPDSVCIHLGLTDYKTFVGTNLSNDWRKFLISVKDDSTRCRHTANPLGNGAIIETTDSKILLLQRSSQVGEFPGHVVFPGGHSEPVEVGITAHMFESSAKSDEELNKKIAAEMFDGIIREVVEETGVPASFLSEPVFLGISQRVMNVRPAAFFYVRCSLSSDAVFDHYNNAEHAFESTKLCAVTRDELPLEAKRMPGCHQGGVALYMLRYEQYDVQAIELQLSSTSSSTINDSKVQISNLQL